ncbi:MAG: dihydrodipicolinate synthase family protein [Acidimicrobiales bacterium]
MSNNPMTISERIIDRRPITGMSAIFLPHRHDGTIDWPGFEAHVARTADAGLTPAVNMDTGFVQLLDQATRMEVLDRTTSLVGGDFVAGADVPDSDNDPFDLDGYVRAGTEIATRGGTPVLFPSWGLNGLDEPEWVEAHSRIGQHLDRFIGFELGSMFVPWGRIYSLEAYGDLLEIPQCIGAKHSSLSRQLEWDRLALRDERRPDFRVFTGNDLAIDMVMYGSDYLLGLSTFAPDLFAERDRLWAAGDPAFYELNDTLQYLGHFTFRTPVPGYRHNAAQFMQLRGWIDESGMPDGAPRRPDSDVEVLAEIATRLEVR